MNPDPRRTLTFGASSRNVLPAKYRIGDLKRINLPDGYPRPSGVITICCYSDACHGKGGRLVRAGEFTFHVSPPGYVRDASSGWAWKSNRARERERRPNVAERSLGRREHGKKGDSLARPLGPSGMPAEAWNIADPDAQMETECTDCGRRLRYSVAEALRETLAEW